MVTSTRETIRGLLGERLGHYIAGTTTSAGSTSTLVDTALQVYDSLSDLVNRWLIITSGDDDGFIARISSLSTSTLTFSPLATGTIASDVTYEIHMVDPVKLHSAILAAGRALYPFVHLPLRDESLIIDDLLTDGGFEGTISGGAFPDWTNVNSPTVTAETSRVFHGSQSAKVVAAGSAGQLTQDLFTSVNVAGLAGKTITFKMWAWASASTNARLKLDWTSSTETGDWHGGESEWELLSVSGTVPTDATTITIIAECGASKTAYFDAGYAYCGPVYKYTIPTSFVGWPHYVTY